MLENVNVYKRRAHLFPMNHNYKYTWKGKKKVENLPQHGQSSSHDVVEFNYGESNFDAILSNDLKVLITLRKGVRHYT